MDQKEDTHISQAERLRELHRGPRILVLPNAWDAATARLFEEAGAFTLRGVPGEWVLYAAH